MEVQVIVNHVGFLCTAKKQVIVKSKIPVHFFQVQDMGIVAAESFDHEENWKNIFEGELEFKSNHEGEFYSGDFSEIMAPGIYSIVVPELKQRSYHFIISDGAFHHIPLLFADFLRSWSGTHETSLKIKSTTDDGIRSDNGEYHPVLSGWYDAGDLRKWMTHTNLPALGFYDLIDKTDFKRNYFHEDNLFENDLLTISDEAVNLILEMQDPETGKIFECLGAGGFGRADENMSWWYENHSGCLADNSDNRFTDNKIYSGDERIIRTDYNALIQYTCITILLRAVKHYEKSNTEKATLIKQAVQRIWAYSKQQAVTDIFEKQTATKSWKLMAANELFKAGLIDGKTIIEIANHLLENYNHEISFWCMNKDRDDPYRGILHSAQPVIALVNYLKLEISRHQKEIISDLLMNTWLNYIKPLCELTIFGYMPYGTYFQRASKNDVYTRFTDKLLYRRFMPCNSKQKINHGLNGHYTSWAHGLALMSNYFNHTEMAEYAWNQIYFTIGYNNFNVSFISGIGYNNPMPHSRFFGTKIGGFMAGFIGNTDDSPHADLKAKAQWNSTEYWNTPLANFCMALSELIPRKIVYENKLGLKR